jgi:hypothetical protein
VTAGEPPSPVEVLRDGADVVLAFPGFDVEIPLTPEAACQAAFVIEQGVTIPIVPLRLSLCPGSPIEASAFAAELRTAARAAARDRDAARFAP